MPKFTSAKRDQRACGRPLLGSLYLQVNKRGKRQIPEFPGLGRDRRGQERRVRRLKVMGHLNPNHCSGLGVEPADQGERNSGEGTLEFPNPKAQGGRGENKGTECL